MGNETSKRATAAPRGSDLAPRSNPILIIDDEDNAELLALGLRRSGHEVRVAFDGRSGLFLAVTTTPQLVFLDLDLPELSGYEVARRLRLVESTRDIPIYATSGYGIPIFSQHEDSAAFTGYLEKPLELDRVLEICRAQVSSSGEFPINPRNVRSR